MTGPETLPPWTPRLYAWSSLEPAWTGVGVFLSLVLVYSAWSHGVIPLLGLETVRAPLWAEVWLAALIAYAPTASVYTVRGTARDRIQGVLPWLLDAPALLRLAVYVLVGLASLLLRAGV